MQFGVKNLLLLYDITSGPFAEDPQSDSSDEKATFFKQTTIDVKQGKFVFHKVIATQNFADIMKRLFQSTRNVFTRPEAISPFFNQEVYPCICQPRIFFLVYT